MNRPGRAAGFSLVELIVVLFIISVLASFTIPYFSPGIPSEGTEATTESLARFMGALKFKALQQNRDYVLQVDISKGQVRAAQSGKQEDAAIAGGLPDEKVQTLSGLPLSGIILTDQTLEPPEIRFYKSGDSDLALIHLEEDGEAVTLKLHPFLMEVEIISGHVDFNDCE